MMTPATIFLPGGRFRMGARAEDKFANTTELPQRMETVAPFSLGVHPVTNREWAVFGEERVGDPECPVTGISWHEVMEWIDRLNRASDGGWRLPTEAEWEYACRAGSESIFPSSEEISPREANFLYDESIERVGPGHLTPVDAYPPNSWGFLDLLGNVSEWTSSPWIPNLAPDGCAITGLRTIRGGSWDALPRLLRPSWRDGVSEGTRRDNLGFRLARG